MNPAYYDPRLQKWLFPHRPKSRSGFQLYTCSAPEFLSDPVGRTRGPAASARPRSKWWTRCLAQDAPEMAPAMPWIDNYIEESQLITTNINISDPFTGSLLVFGNAVDKEGHGERLTNTAAFPRGEAGADLVVSEMKLHEYDIGKKGTELWVPRILATSHEPAHQFGSPIRQICSAGNPYKGDCPNPRLAVRISGATTIFKQVRLSAPLRNQSNRIILQSLVAVKPSTSGASDHVDVSFNPFYDRQFGTIDQQRSWEVWEIEGAYETFRLHNGLKPKSVAKGRIVNEETVGEGWGRIIWGSDPNTIFACDRKNSVLFDIREAPSMRSNILLPMDRDRNWILDFIRAPSTANRHEAFLLTSSNIICVDARMPGNSLLNWPHRRHRDDVSMYLELFRENNITTAIIGSRMNFLTTCHNFSFQGTQSHFPTVLNDPYIINPPFYESNPSSAAINMAILPCAFRDSDSIGRAISIDDKARGTRFFTGFSINKKLEIAQRIYSTKPGHPKPAPRRTALLVGKALKSAEFLDVDADSKLSSLNDVDKSLLNKPKLNVMKNHRRKDLHEMYNFVFVDLDMENSLKTAHDEDEENSAEGYVRQVSRILENRIKREELGISTLLEVRWPNFLFHKLSELDFNISGFLNSPEFNSRYKSKPLLPKNAKWLLLNDSDPDSFSPVSLYENLVATYVTPLPTSTPGRVRLHRERVARLLATEIYLATKGVNLIPSQAALHPPEISKHKGNHPITPSPEVDSPSGSEDRKNNSDKEPLERLRAYGPIKSRVILSPGLKSVLDNWKLGEDPSQFEFDVDPDEGVPRYKKDRRKARKEKRLSDLNVGGTERIGASQPLPSLLNIREMDMSSQLGESRDNNQSQAISMSQVERGKYGGRKVLKKRKTGF